MRNKISTIIILLVSQLTYAQTQLPTFDCSLSDALIGDNAVGEKTLFKTQTAMIYYVCKSSNVVKGQVLKSVWIAVDSHGMAPENFKIDESNLTVADTMTGNMVYTAKFAQPKPKKGWPVGTYKVKLLVNGSLAKSQLFVVK
jgi:hypothetical protein